MVFKRMIFGDEFWWYCKSDGVVNVVEVYSRVLVFFWIYYSLMWCVVKNFICDCLKVKYLFKRWIIGEL